jgi:3-oxocholest-4-en-26-oyl-CoA dehydrogenase beta subunit
MDFSLSEEQQALGDLVDRILSERVTHDRLVELERGGGAVFDREVWRQLADAGVLAATVPAEHGGSGLTILDLLGVFEAAGRSLAPVPLVPTVVTALAIARFGSAQQKAEILPGVADGSVILTFALEDPEVTVDDGRLSGELQAVPYAQHAAHILVPAGDALYLADPRDAELTEQLMTNRQPIADVRLEAAPSTLLTADPQAVTWVVEHAAAAVCAVQAGVCDAALRITAKHTATRQQFGKPIAEFQAVAQRAADAFIDAQMVRLTAWQALFRLTVGWPASNEVHVAKFWAGEGAMRVVHATQHLHGGLGVDTDYPVHRYFLWAKQNEHTLGTPTRELIRLGTALADEPV